MQTYNVSRTVIREALKTLAAKGLTQSKARVGIRVCDKEQWNFFDHTVLVWHARNGFSVEFLDHLGEIRMALEPEGAALAARRRTKAQLEDMHEWIAALRDPNKESAEHVVRARIRTPTAFPATAGPSFAARSRRSSRTTEGVN